MPYLVSWQNQKVTYEKYVGEKWKIQKTEWTEIRGWEATFERVAFHISRGSTQWAGGTQGEPVLGRSSFHRHGHQYHINHADYYKNNKWWALNMMLFATVTSSRMKNYFSGCYCRPPSPSPRRRAPPCACNLPLNDVAMVTLSWCLLVSADAVLSESQVHCKTQDLHHLHASHYGDGRRCPMVTLSCFSLILASIAATWKICVARHILLKIHFCLDVLLLTLQVATNCMRTGLTLSPAFLLLTYFSSHQPSLQRPLCLHRLGFPPVGLGSSFITEHNNLVTYIINSNPKTCLLLSLDLIIWPWLIITADNTY